jgi:hypothetical protein
LNVIGFHPISDALSLSPTVLYDLVSTEVNILILKSVIDVAHHILDHFPSKIKSGIELAHIDAVTGQSNLLQLLASAPRLSMGRRIYFRNHTDTPNPGILDDLLNIGFREDSSNASEVTKLRHFRHLHGERILVNDVPMQNIEFRVKHMVKSLDDFRNRQVMSGGVDHESTPFEGRSIFNSDGQSSDLIVILLINLEQL